MQKHYDSTYLECTYKLAKETKEKSYAYLRNIEEGLVVDLGCGTGIDVLALAKNANYSVLGVDHDKKMIEVAQNNLKNTEFSNVRFEVGNAENIPLQNDLAVCIRAERVFQHLQDQQKVLKEINRCLVPGGDLVIVETDWLGFTVYNEYTDLINQLQQFLAEKKVNNGFASRNLFSDLNQFGFSISKVELVPLIVTTLDEANQYFKLEEIIHEMNEQNYLSEQDCQNLIQSFAEQDEKSYFHLSLTTLIFHAIKI